jgi:hypothetical protein
MAREHVPKKHSGASIIEDAFPGQRRISRFHGTLNNYAVWITEPSEIDELVECGFYGKGILSRSKPVFEKEVGKPTTRMTLAFASVSLPTFFFFLNTH